MMPTASQWRGSSASHSRKRPGACLPRAFPLLPARFVGGRVAAGRVAVLTGRAPAGAPAGGRGGGAAARVQPSRPRTAISSRHSRLERPLPGCSTASPASRRRVTTSIWEDRVAAPRR